MDVQKAIELTSIIIGIIISSITIWTKIINPLIQKRKKLIENRKINSERMQDALSKLDLVLKEVLPNGGKSLRDTLNRVENNIYILNEKIDSLEETHRISLNLQQIAYWVCGKQGEVVYTSPSMCKLIKRLESEMLGHGWLSCISPNDSKRIAEAWELSIEEGRTFDETYTFTSDQYSIKVRGIAYHKKDSQGKYIGSYGTLIKIK